MRQRKLPPFLLTPGTWNTERYLGCVLLVYEQASRKKKKSKQKSLGNRDLLVIFIPPLLSPSISITVLLFYFPPCQCTVCTVTILQMHRDPQHPLGKGHIIAQYSFCIHQEKPIFSLLPCFLEATFFQIWDSEALMRQHYSGRICT